MKSIKLLPVALAVTSVFSTFAVVADDSLSFTGYARYGAAYQNGDSLLVKPSGSLNGNSTGRLGNEDNGGEFQFNKVFESDNGTNWDLVVMFDHWANSNWGSESGVNIRKAYVGASNVFEAQPDLYIWAGRNFHQRPQTNLNDYFWMSHDSQGGGFNNLAMGDVKLDMGFMGQYATDKGNYQGNDSGKYAITSKFHNIKLGDSVDLSLYANVGFASEQAKGESYEDTTAFQIGTEVKFGNQRVIVRYADNAKDSVYDLVEDQSALLVSFDGTAAISDKAAIEYLAAYQTLDVANDADDRSNYNVIVRPTYAWNDIHSTWLEAGYDVVDYDNTSDTNSAWKVTFSQNIAIGGMTWSRPMLRFYATVGDADNEVTNETVDTMTIGAMWEAWW